MIFREKTFKRVTCIILAALIAIPGAFPVYAEKEDTDAGQERRPALTLNKKESKETYRDKELENTVVVMFKDDSEVTKKEAKKTLESGDLPVDDIRVSEVWNFQTDDPSDGLKLDSDEESYANVALVKSDSMSAGKLAKKLRQRDDVRYAEKNHRIHMLSVTNDTYSDLQWSMQSEENAPNIEYEWNKGVTGSEKIVAIVDSGVDYTHPDIKDNMWKNTHKDSELKGTCGFDFIDGDRDPMDENGHGTHCAGIIGAAGNNSEGISGVNQKIRIMALRILNAEGSAYLSHEIAAYNYINDALDLGEPVAAINNSWGGGDRSQIMEDLADIVGAKGAITVCASGNESLNSDEYPSYPADIDSQYVVSVAASGTDGKLADFSNYGESVDVAAPGTDILSSVSYDCYNPTIYNDEEQQEISEEYNGYEDDSETWARPSADDILINGKRFGDMTDREKGNIEITEEDAEGFLDKEGKSFKISMKNLPAESIACFTIPYELHDGYAAKPSLSAMMRAEGPDNASSIFGGSLYGMVDVDADAKEDVSGLGNAEIEGGYAIGDPNYWTHLKKTAFSDEGAVASVGKPRKFVVFVYAYAAGDYALQIDDIGISSQDVETERYGKYDFYNGTSMAAPYISGTFALKAAQGDKDPVDIISEVVSSAKEEPELKTGSKGVLDFRKAPSEAWPRIGSVSVDTETDTVRIEGSGFDPSDNSLKVELGESEDDLKEAEIVEKDKRYVVIRNDHWINNIETIKVTGFGGKTSVKKNIYLVKGKKKYEEKKDAYLELSDEDMVTDGRNIYSLNSRMRAIDVTAVSKDGSDADTLAVIDCDKLFGIEKDENKKYGMVFNGGLAYANGAVYTVVEYGAADQKEGDDEDEWFWRTGKSGARDDDDDDDDDYDEEDENESEIYGDISVYSGECRFIKIDADTGKLTNLGGFPEPASDLESTDGYTIAAYNGKIFFIGGHSYAAGDQGLSDKVYIYDPKANKWSEGAPLPEKRALGKALQSGDKLYYTLGISDDQEKAEEIPDALVFDGSSWNIVGCGTAEKMYGVDDPSVSIVKGGLLYTGAPVYDYGDTFRLDGEQKKYIDTGYNFVSDPEDYVIRAIAVGDTLYGSCDEEVFTMPVESGFINISVKKKGNGKIQGAGFLAPGNDAKLTVKAGKNCHIKSIKVGGKAVKVKKNAAKQVVTIRRPTKDQKVDVVFAKNKKVKVTVSKTGKGKVKGAKKYYVGQKVKLTVTASKGSYIRSLKVGKKNVKLKGKPVKKVYTIRKIKKNTAVKVVFAKK